MAATEGRSLSETGGRSRHYDDGIRFFDEGLYEQAVAAFRDALSVPGRSPLTDRLARFYLAEAHSALALQKLSKSEDACDDETLENLRSAVELRPHYADLHYHLGCALLSRGAFDEAIASLCRAREINPGYAKATHALGVALYAGGRREEGLRMAHSALVLDPVFRRTAYYDAERADTRGDHENALLALRRMADSEGGDDALFHARTAQDLFRRGMYEEAVDEYQQALTIHPGYADLRNQFGAALLALHRDRDAVFEFRTALEINPRYKDAHLNLGLALARLGERDEARKALLTVLEQDAANAAALEALSSLEEKPAGL